MPQPFSKFFMRKEDVCESLSQVSETEKERNKGKTWKSALKAIKAKQKHWVPEKKTEERKKEFGNEWESKNKAHFRDSSERERERERERVAHYEREIDLEDSEEERRCAMKWHLLA